MKSEYGIALSGGAVRGIAHLGALKALEEAGIYPDVVSGISAGSIVGALYADGFAPDEIFDMFSKKGFYRFVKFGIPQGGLMQLGGLIQTLRDNLRHQNFEELEKPYFVGATRLDTGELEYFQNGDVSSAVEASCSVPGLFQPAERDGIRYLDGGVVCNLPVEPLLDKADKIIGINVVPMVSGLSYDHFGAVLEQTFAIVAKANMKPWIDQCDIFIEPTALARHSFFSKNKERELFEIGYHKAQEVLAHKNLLP